MKANPTVPGTNGRAEQDVKAFLDLNPKPRDVILDGVDFLVERIKMILRHAHRFHAEEDILRP